MCNIIRFRICYFLASIPCVVLNVITPCSWLLQPYILLFAQKNTVNVRKPKMPNYQQAISELPFASVSKRVHMQTHSNENDFDLHKNGCEGLCDGGKHFHMNRFAHRLILKLKQKATWKWPITYNRRQAQGFYWQTAGKG